MPVNNMRPMLLNPLPLVVLAVSVSVVIWLLTQSTPLATGKRLSVHHALQNIPEKDIDKYLSELIPANTFTGKDPFFRSPTAQKIQPAASTETIDTDAELREIQLTTIAHGKNGSYCLVNGNIYQEGQKGDGFTAEHISPDEVIFSTPAQTFSLEPGQNVTLEGGKIRSPNKREE